MIAPTLRSVCVFTGSSLGTSPHYEAAAERLGQCLAARRLTLVYGGATVGLMGTIADAALAGGGSVTGVLPRKLMDLEIGHTGLTQLHVVETMHERKTMMADASDAFIALPGGLGTLEETFEVWTWSQLGVHAKPVGFLNVNGFFDRMLAFLDHAVDEGFIKPRHRDFICVSEDPETLLDALAATDTSYEPKWIDTPAR